MGLARPHFPARDHGGVGNLPATTKKKRQGGTRCSGLMQDWPLLCHRILDHAATFHADRPIVSRLVEGPIHRTTYGEVRNRALKVAQRLERDGIRPRRPGRDAGLEHVPPCRGLVRHHGDRRGLSHRQPAPVPRPDRMDRQSRRGSRDDDRSHLRSAAGKARRPAARRSSAISCSPMPRICRIRR